LSYEILSTKIHPEELVRINWILDNKKRVYCPYKLCHFIFEEDLHNKNDLKCPKCKK
jgi:hypothetical protein